MVSCVKERTAYKAVKLTGSDRLYTLGMGQARVISLPGKSWVRGGPFGISAAKRRKDASEVIFFAMHRKVKPCPERVAIVKIAGRGIILENNWRYLFREIQVLEIGTPIVR
jgi:hypothetical protein